MAEIPVNLSYFYPLRSRRRMSSPLHIRIERPKYLTTHRPNGQVITTSFDLKMQDKNTDDLAGILQNLFHYQPAHMSLPKFMVIGPIV